MRFEKFGANLEKIKITLSPHDMNSLQITYRQMDYSDQKTRTVLQKLLELAQQKTGFSCPDHGKLLIELFPVAEGGCTVIFTVISTEEMECIVFSFSQLETMIQAAVKAVEQGYCPHPDGCCCSLYRLSSEYRIVCRPLRALSPCAPILAEYGRNAGTGELAQAFTAEHGRLLLSPNALQRLAKDLG